MRVYEHEAAACHGLQSRELIPSALSSGFVIYARRLTRPDTLRACARARAHAYVCELPFRWQSIH